MHLCEDVTAKYCKYCIIWGLISRSECNLATEDAKRVNEMQNSLLKNFHILTWKVIYLFIMDNLTTHFKASFQQTEV